MTNENIKKRRKKNALEQEVIIELGARLKAFRKELNLSQKELCDKIEVTSHTTLSDIETGKTTPGYEFIYKLSLHFNLNPLYLIHGREPKLLAPVLNNETSKKGYNFGTSHHHVIDMLACMQASQETRAAVLAYFDRYKIDNAQALAEFFKQNPQIQLKLQK